MIVYVALFVLVFVAALLLVWALRPGGEAAKAQVALERLDSYDVRAYRQAELSRSAGERLASPVFASLAAAGRMITPTGRTARLEDKLEQAGRPWNLDLNGLLAIKIVSLVMGLLVVVIFASLRLLPAFWLILFAVAVAVATYYVPDMILHHWISSRKHRISQALPDFLDLLTVTVEAGLGLDSAMAKIAEKMREPLRQEILITLHHMRIGQSRETALREFARRCGVKDLDTFVSTLIQSQRLGVPMGKILRSQSTNIRIVRRQRVEETAQKAPVKMLFPLVFCIFPALFVVILGPAAIRVYDALFR